jgi:ribonuclease HII
MKLTAALKMKEIAYKLKSIHNPKDAFLAECRLDERKGVKDLIKKWDKQLTKLKEEKELFQSMSSYEQALKKEGFSALCGIDEAGRGPLCGPVVACAVILKPDFYLAGLNDSKKLSEAKREEFFTVIQNEAESIGVGIIHSDEIDSLNIYQASKKAMNEAILNLSSVPDHLLIDAMELEIDIPQFSIVKGDSKSISIAAASVIAKVTRDKLMKEYSIEFPQYGFEQHMGYGTKRHLEALHTYGLTPWHRRSFAPVKEIAEKTVKR